VDGYIDPILALQNFKRGLYQLLILDIKMPKMDGMDLLDKIKKEDDKIKVCFFTASEEFASNYENAFNNSKDKFLTILKPISIPIMIKQIEQFLSL
jgi:CheY-like chemotaxis protein